MREQKAQRRRKPFQTTYQPSHCFHTGPSSRHEESNKVRHLLFCLKAAAVTWGVCSVSIKNAVCWMFTDQRYYCRPKEQNVAFRHITGQPTNSFIIILKQQYVTLSPKKKQLLNHSDGTVSCNRVSCVYVTCFCTV